MIHPATGMKAGERYIVESLERARHFPGFFLDGKYYLGPDLMTAIGWLEGQQFYYDELDPTGEPVFPNRLAGKVEDLTLILADGARLPLHECPTKQRSIPLTFRSVVIHRHRDIALLQQAINTESRASGCQVNIPTAAINLKALGLDISRVNLITRDDVKYGKPDPDLFLAAATKLNVPIEDCLVIGDAIWDMLAARRCKATGIGLLSGGYDTGELERAGALRVYEDPLALLQHLDEVASRP
ncbi:HAD-IA family hydrolase [Pseudomonas fluorescens]|uniref:HAD family hydrolase n=1 Tax=Pseudomonas fluorescens TaxID=294 RepID=UPI0030D7D995